MRTVAGLLVKRDDRVLLVFKNGFWFFPGGKREASESLEETVLRELYEELHLVCRKPDLRLVHQGVFTAPRGEEFRFHTFTCDHTTLYGRAVLDPRDSVKDWGWIDHPLELNLTDHARFILERDWSLEGAAV